MKTILWGLSPITTNLLFVGVIPNYSAAKKPATSEPILVPAIISMGIPASCKTLMTPMCANPFAEPPESAKPTVGRRLNFTP